MAEKDAAGIPAFEVTVSRDPDLVRVSLTTTRGRVVVLVRPDGHQEVGMDIKVYGRTVAGSVVLKDTTVVENTVEVVGPGRKRLSAAQQQTCARLAVTYVRHCRRQIRAAEQALHATNRALRGYGL